jgi:hypothetical protein
MVKPSLRRPQEGRLAEPRIITVTNLAGLWMSGVTVLSRVLILTTPDGGDAPAYPPVPVDDLVERPPVRPDERS